MKVGRYDYRQQFADFLPGLVGEFEEMLTAGEYVLTAQVASFEDAFARYLGVAHALGVNSGTDALVLALRALDIGPGDEVITQANTFYATVAAIRLVGANPVLVDAEPRGYLMDTDHLATAVTARAKAIMPVHLYGKPTAMAPVLALAERHGLAVIEDAAQAHGARSGQVMAGAAGTLGCFSFHPSKNLAAAGDGGAVVTENDALAEKIRQMRCLGQAGQNNHVTLGLNSKLDAIHARVLHHKLPLLDSWNAERRAIAAEYRALLADLPLRFQALDPDEEHVFHLFQVETRHRDGLLAHLRERGVDAVIRYPVPIHLQPAFTDLGWRRGMFPVAERLAQELLCLPIRPGMSAAEIEWTANAVREFFAERGP